MKVYLSTLAVLLTGCGVVNADVLLPHSTTSTLLAEQTDPLFGGRGIYSLDPVEPSQDPNTVGAHCEEILARFQTHRAGLMDTKEWRTLIMTEAWAKTAGPINNANEGNCEAPQEWAEGVDCGKLGEAITQAFEVLRREQAYLTVRAMVEFHQLRADYMAVTAKKCLTPDDAQ